MADLGEGVWVKKEETTEGRKADIGHPCNCQLTPVKTRHLLTSILRLYCRLKFTAIEVTFFWKLIAGQVLVFYWIAGSHQLNLLHV